MMNRIVKILCCALMFSTSLHPITVGSDSAVSRQAQASFPTQTDNLILGFARMENGFVLADRRTTCSYDNFIPVAGGVNLADGTLILNQDLTFENPLSFINGGKVLGNSLAFELPRATPDITLLNNGVGTSFNFITSNNAQGGSLRIWANDWNFNDNYVASGSENSGTAELVIYYFDGSTLTNTKSVEQGAIVNSVHWHPTQNYLAVARDGASGNEFQVYNFNVSNGSLTLTASADYAANDAKAVEWHKSGNFVVVGTSNNAKEIVVYSFNDITGATSEKFAVNLSPDRDVNIGAMSFSPGGNLLAVGVDFNATVGANELLVYSFNNGNGALTINSGIDADVGIEALDWNPTGTYIAAGTFGSSSGDLRIYAHDAATNSITLVTQVVATDVNAVAWDRTGQYLAVGYESITGPNLKVYYFDKTNLTLTDVGDMPVPADVDYYSVTFSHNNNYLAAGDRESRTVIYGISRGGFLIFIDTKVIFNSDVNFTVPVHFQGNCTISGRANGLNLINNGKVVVRPNSRLTIEDVEMRNLGDGKLACLTDSGSLTFENSILNLSRDYTFSRGSILFNQDNFITGSNKFIYTTNLASTIDSQSMLYMGYGTTFSYSPRTAKRDLIFMTNTTSQLFLDGSSLHVTRTGLQLSAGTLILDDLVTVSSEARVPAEGIRLNSDLTVNVRGNANVQLFGIIRAD